MQVRTTALSDQLLHYGVALLSVALALGTTLLLGSYLETTPTSLFFVAVMVSAWYGGLKPGIVATVLSSLAINYFLTEPIYVLSIPDLGTLVRLGVFVMAAILISSLNAAQQLAQRRAEINLKSLRESEARFGCLAESNIIGMMVAELDGAVLEANDAFLQMVGYTQEELRSGRLRWNEMTPPESLEVSNKAVQELITAGACSPFEKEYVRKNGSRVPVLHGAIMTGKTTITGFVVDLSERKRAEETLQRTNQTLQTLLDACPVAIAFFDPQGIVRVWNRAAEQIFGWSAAEAIGQFMPTVLHRRQEFLASIQTVLSGRSLNGLEAQHQHKDGRMVDLEIWANLAHDAAGNPGCLGIAWDITERKRTEEALRQSEARFQVLVSNMPGMVYRYAPGADGAPTFTYISSGSRELVELEPETILQDADAFFRLVHPDDLPSFQNSVAIAIDNSAVWQWEGRIITPSGQLKWLQGRSRPQQIEYGEAWDGLFIDITDRKQAEEALRQSDRRFKSVFNQQFQYMAILTPEGRVIDVNDSPLKATGIKREEVIGQLFWETPWWTPLPDMQALWIAHVTQVRQGGAPITGETYYATKDDTLRFSQYALTAVKDETDQVVNLIIQASDLTDRKQAEESLRASEERFQLIAQASNDVMWDCDLLTHEMWWSERIQLVFGYRLEELGADRLGWAKRVHPDDLDRVQASYRACLDSSETVWTDEYRFRRAEGSYADILDRAFIIRDPAGTPTRIVGAMSDISDRKRIENERKRVQQELQQALQTLQTIVAASPLPIVVIEPDMTVQLWNAAAEQLFGWSEAEVLGQLLPLVPEEKQEECRQLREAVTNGEVFSSVETYRRKRDGSKVILNISAAPLYDDQGSVNAILLILQDITERQRAEAALRDSEERLRLALIAANQGLYDLNVQTGDAIVSPAYAQMLGYDPDEFEETNTKWRDRLHPDDVAVVYQAYEDYVAGKLDTYRVEFRQRTKSGDWKWLLSIGKIVAWDSDGQPLRMLGTHTDMTDRKQAEEALRQSEERLRLALDAGCMGAWEWNLETNVQQWDVNQYKLFGMDKDRNRLSADAFFQFIHPDDLPLAQQLTEQVLEQGGSFHTEFRIVRPDGGVRWLSSQGIVVQDKHNQPVRIIGVNFDITERKREEEERERLLANEQLARQEAEAANRIKDEFLAVLSHELRSPLNPILGWSRLLQTQKLDEQKTRQALATIERNAKLQTQLIEDLLDVSRILRGKLVLNIAPVSLINTIEAALETVRLAVEAKGIQIQRTFNLDLDQVMGDTARLQQVIWNLLTNAVKFTPSGGTVEIRLEQSNNQIQIQVKDTGKGIRSDFLPYVFDYFRQEDGTTTRKFGGLGLGLAIVRHITELHGGTVWAESPGEGLGATFTVQLPLMPSPVRGDEKDEPSTIANLCGLRVLAVDDDKDIRELLEFILQQAGAEVRVVASATEALQQLEAFSPKVLISDVGMPDTDGYMLIRQIRTLAPEQGKIPAIALTAYAGEIDQQQALAAGFQMHLAKPIEPEKLIGVITNLLKENSIVEL
jgi:PAS domain S-box-containing protein